MGLEVAKEKFNNAVQKAKKFIVGDTRQEKLEILLDHVIDTIELRGNDVYIKTKKNIAIQNDGHLVQINSGVHVLLSKEIHFNPKIGFQDNNFEELQGDLDEARRIEEVEYQEKLKKIQEEHQFCNN